MLLVVLVSKAHWDLQDQQEMQGLLVALVCQVMLDLMEQQVQMDPQVQ